VLAAVGTAGTDTAGENLAERRYRRRPCVSGGRQDYVGVLGLQVVVDEA
jgi:hypothetical protein